MTIVRRLALVMLMAGLAGPTFTGCATTDGGDQPQISEARDGGKRKRARVRRQQMSERELKRIEARLIKRGNRARYAPALDSW